MAVNRRVGEPIPTGIFGSDGTPLTREVSESERAGDSQQQLDAIKEEIRQVSHMISHLTETTTRYAQERVQTAAQTAVDRYPIGSIVLAALAGYWLAGRNRRY
ncbi:MAG: hypothetical protein JWM58_2696 [Rhizobium sp.]|nr:hypothetical protein [Rhizobium sp.]